MGRNGLVEQVVRTSRNPVFDASGTGVALICPARVVAFAVYSARLPLRSVEPGEG